MCIYPISTLISCLFLASALAQSAIPPSTAPDASTTPLPSSGAVTITVTSSTIVPSGSATTSGNATMTSSAQFPSLSGVSSCVSDCLAQSIGTVGCSSVVDVNCFCPIDRFPLTYMNCVVGSCPSDLASAENLANQFCQQSNTTSTSLSFPSVPTSTSGESTGTSSATVGSSSTTSGPTTTSNAAVRLFGVGGVGGGDTPLLIGVPGALSGLALGLCVVLGAIVI